MSQPRRTSAGGSIDRTRRYSFLFNGRRYEGYAGDTLASALLANDIHLIGRSFKYHRPRGIFGLSSEEPNALVQLGSGGRMEPNSKATEISLFDGLEAASQNCWPSVSFDLGAVTGLFSRLLPAGFYYKTFMWPHGRWMAYEAVIRRMAGMGRSAVEPDPDRYEHSHAHCDVLVVGGGPAGLAAALSAGRSGARVLLVESDPQLGGALLASHDKVGTRSATDWVSCAITELRALPDVRVLSRTTAFGYYDHNQIGAIERLSDHLPTNPGVLRQRLWHVHAREVVLATGAHERSMVFANNDLPGIMLASAARGYLNRYAVRAGRSAVVFTNNDSAYAAALDLASGGIEVRAVVDARAETSADLVSKMEQVGIDVLAGTVVTSARGRRHVALVSVASVDVAGETTGAERQISCDLLCVSGGWNPTIHLHAQARGKPVYDHNLATFVPGSSVQRERSAGASRGVYSTTGCVIDGARAGVTAASAAGFEASVELGAGLDIEPVTEKATAGISMICSIPAHAGAARGKRFVDLQDDVTDADIALAVREGYRSVEHVKRYTTLGMGTDQGKTSNTIGFAHIAKALNVDIPSVGTTTFRPPYVPVALGALAGMEGGRHFMPNRRTAMHDCHIRAGAIMLQSGPWLRPQCYPRAGESLDDAVRREAAAVRGAVGMVDVSTLGKFELIGPDAAEFLERVYVNRWRSLKVGRCRYGVMLREDGMVFDDGTTTRIGDTRYFMTTTTAQAPLMARRLDYWHRVLWPELNLRIVNVTEQWAAVAVAGPDSRKVLSQALTGLDVSPEALPYMGYSGTILGAVEVRVFRISFSGDLAYEVYVPADFGAAAWDALAEAGSAFGIKPYGIDAINTLRIEKGHVAGGELNGRVTADDLGLGRMIKASGDFIGRRSLSRLGLKDPARWQLVGLLPQDGSTPLPPGSKLTDGTPGRYVGELTSSAWSPMLNGPIALGLLSGGRTRHGEILTATSPLAGRDVPVIVRDPLFVDPEGKRLNA